MRNDVVNHCGRHKSFLPQAFHAERVSSQVQQPRFPPSAIVAPAGRALTGVSPAMFLAIHIVCQIRAPRMAAGTLRFSWHTPTCTISLWRIAHILTPNLPSIFLMMPRRFSACWVCRPDRHSSGRFLGLAFSFSLSYNIHAMFRSGSSRSCCTRRASFFH